METFKKLQKRIYANKVKKGFNTKADYQGIDQEICFLVEELGELAHHHRRGEKDKIIDDVMDLLIYLLGLCEILGIDTDKELGKTINEIEKREYILNLDGTLKKR